MLHFITRNDFRVMQRANNWAAPRWVQICALSATRLGDGWLWCALGGAILLLGDGDRYAALGAEGLAAVASVLSFMGLKRLAGRRRPCAVEPHCWAKLLPPDHFSFPSGHTMTAFAIAIAVSLFYPVCSPVLFFFAFSIAISRILLGMHFVSDVLAGVLLGIGLGCGAYWAFA